MIYSMTGYAAAACAVKGGAVQIELKSVNSRYLDYHFRVCDELRIAEPALRELIGARLVRGKLECRVSFIATASAAQQASLNAELLARLGRLDTQIRAELPLAAPLAVSDVLRWPGIFGDVSLDIEAVLPACRELARAALDDFVASRAREGEKLAAVILDKVTCMRGLLRQTSRFPDAGTDAGSQYFWLQVAGCRVVATGDRVQAAHRTDARAGAIWSDQRCRASAPGASKDFRGCSGGKVSLQTAAEL
jgi:uncharacterized protein (TIGR00255 family)